MADDTSINTRVPSLPPSPVDMAKRKPQSRLFPPAPPLTANLDEAGLPRPRSASCACLAFLAALWLLHLLADPLAPLASALRTDPCLPPLMQRSCDADPPKQLCFGKAWASGAPELRRDAHVSLAYSLRVGGGVWGRGGLPVGEGIAPGTVSV